nr:hypothetical protein [Tanacetum cinerariifolium]
MNATLEAEVLTRSSHSSRTSYAIAADLLEMELKKILIEKMEGNKSIQRSDEQRNLYKALVEAYDADKAILDTYGESTILSEDERMMIRKDPPLDQTGGLKDKKKEVRLLLLCSAMGTVFVVTQLLLDASQFLDFWLLILGFGLLPLVVLCDLAEGITLGLEFLSRSCIFFLASSR